MNVDLCLSRKVGLAWATGFYEGEGHISSYKPKGNRNNWTLQLTVAQNHSEPLEWFRDVFGVGKIYQNKNGLYVYKVSGFENVQYINAMMWPFLSHRRRQQSYKAIKDFLDAYRAPRQTSHGTTRMYSVYHCRCRPCKDASAASARRYRARKKAYAS